MTKAHDTAERLTALEMSVAALEGKGKSWYKNPGTLISFVALLLSLTAFGYTSYREINKEKEQRKDHFRSALSELISQLNSMSAQAMEVMYKYRSEPFVGEIAVNSISNQLRLVGNHAYDLLTSLGNEASVFDGVIIAKALQEGGDLDTSAKPLTYVLPLARTPSEYLIVTRMLGGLKYQQGNFDDGNKYFEMALQVSRKFAMDQNEINSNNVNSEIYWALMAAGKQCKLARQHAAEAENLISNGSSGLSANKTQMLDQIQSVSKLCPD